MLHKKEIREATLKMRMALSLHECVVRSEKLCSRFFESFEFSEIKVLHTFLPLVSKNEPDTWQIIGKLNRDFSHVRVSIPKVEDDHLVNYYFKAGDQLKKNRWGIFEPDSGEETATTDVDLVLVPLLAFDSNGSRVGYGKGFYDKFLGECREDCKKIGLSFFQPTNDLIQVDSYDVRLDAVVTPTQVYTFKV